MISFEPFIPYILPIVLLCLLFMITRSVNIQRRAPIDILLLVWIFTFISHMLVTTSGFMALYPSSLTANLIITVAVWAFSLGYMMFPVARYAIEYQSEDSRHESKRSIQLDIVILALSIAVLIWLISFSRDLSASAYRDYSLFIVRHQINYGGFDWGPVGHASLAVTSAAVYMISRYRRSNIRSKLITYCVVACAAAIAALLTQRTSLLMLIVAAVFTMSANRVPNIRWLTISAATLILGFIALGVALGKVGHADSSILTNIKAGLQSALFYFLSPLSAFANSEIWMNAPMNGAYILRLYNLVLSSLGLLNTDTPSLVMQFVYVPNPTNVYTAFYTMVSDFGRFYPILALAYGLIYGAVFALPNTVPVRALRGFMFYPLIMTFFSGQFAELTSQWLQIALATAIIHIAYLATEGRLYRKAALR